MIVNKFSKNNLLIIPILIFSTILFYSLFFHEPWRDELQAWLLITNNNSLLDLFKSLRYEGTTGLWHFLLFLLKYIWNDFFIMRLLNVFISIAVAILIIYYSPFKLYQKILLIFGYYPLYEYGVISRSYSLTILLIFLLCYLFKNIPKNLIKISLAIFLLIQTNIFGVIGSVTFLGYLLISIKEFKDLIKSKIKLFLAFYIIAVGFLIAYFQVKPPVDVGILPQHKLGDIDIFLFQACIKTVWRSFVPMPRLIIEFWNTNFMDNNEKYILILSIILIFLVVYLLIKNIKIFIFYISTVFLIMCLFYFNYFGYLRHWGFLFIFFVAALWLKYNQSKNKQTNIYIDVFFTTILFIHIIASTVALYYDIKYPFTNSRNLINQISEQKLITSDLLIAGETDYLISPLSAYLNQDIYYPNSNRFGSYIVWDNKRFNKSLEEQILGVINKKNELNKKTYFITSYPINQDLVDKYRLFFMLKMNNESIVKNEVYYFYSL